MITDDDIKRLDEATRKATATMLEILRKAADNINPGLALVCVDVAEELEEAANNIVDKFRGGSPENN